MKNKQISILVPAYNAENFIDNSILQIISKMHEIKITNYEIILIENGSTDQTKDIVKNLSKEYNQINLISLPYADLGKAIKTGIKISKGIFSIYLPADLSYGIDFIEKTIKFKNEYDVIFGSKKLKQSKVRIEKSRIILSDIFSFIVRILFNFKVKDTQGVKAFKTDLFKNHTDNFPDGYLWDIGFVYLTKKNNYRWIEIPCEVIDLHKRSSVKKIRTAIKMFFGLIKFRFQISQKP